GAPARPPTARYSSAAARLSRDEGATTSMPELAGTWFVLPTPFVEDGSVDLPSQRTVVGAAVRWGVDGLTAMGVTSEAAALTPAERDACLREIFDAAAGAGPIVVGCSGASAAVVRAVSGAAS